MVSIVNNTEWNSRVLYLWLGNGLGLPVRNTPLGLDCFDSYLNTAVEGTQEGSPPPYSAEYHRTHRPGSRGRVVGTVGLGILYLSTQGLTLTQAGLWSSPCIPNYCLNHVAILLPQPLNCGDPRYES